MRRPVPRRLPEFCLSGETAVNINGRFKKSAINYRLSGRLLYLCRFLKIWCMAVAGAVISQGVHNAPALRGCPVGTWSYVLHINFTKFDKMNYINLIKYN